MNPMQNTDGTELTGNREQRRAASRRSKKLVAVGSGAVLVAGIAGPTVLSQSPVSAATTFTVDSLADSGAGTLRDAIESANAAAGADVINFQSGLTGTITLATDLPKITEAVAIEGPGAAVLAVDGGGTANGGGNSIFNFYGIASGTDTVSGLTLTHGEGHNNDGSGGAIMVWEGSADTNLTGLVITENHSDNDGGGVILYDTVGNATITDSQITNNKTFYGGGGLYADEGEGVLTLTINNSTISGNIAGDGHSGEGSGGGLYTTGVDVTITNSTISGNGALYSGGGVYLNNGTATITDSTISGNIAYNSGGGLYLADMTTTITNSTISGNTAKGGGGVKLYNGSSYSFTMRNSTVSGNTATGYGGGFYISDSNAGPITIENSTISGNTASQAGAIYGSYGGLTIIQTTITANTATVVGDATAVGGVQLSGTPATSRSAAKKASKNGAKKGAGVHGGKEQAKHHGPSRAAAAPAAAGNSEMELVGTIIAGNVGQDIGIYGGAPTVSSDHSVLGTVDVGVPVTDVGGTQLNVADPKLGPLASNGGPTKTHALLDGSPALDMGPNPEPSFTGNEFDQRGPGYIRVANGVADVGAFEVQPVIPTPPTTEPPAVEPVVVPTFTG